MEIKSNFAAITSKDNGGDMFRHLAQEASAQLHKADKEWVNYKFRKFRLEAVLKRMRSILRAGLISGPRAVMGFVKALAVVKQLFLLEFETGNAALIPPALRQDDLPLSFRYYDPILQYVDGRLSRERQDYFKMKKQLRVIFHAKLDEQQLFRCPPAARAGHQREASLTQTKDPKQEIRIHESKHCG